MNCCGRTAHVISVRVDSVALSMLRCPACGGQVWAQDGNVLDRDDVFAHLAQAFQGPAAVAQEARRSTAAAAERRAAQRDAASSVAEQPQAAAQPERRPTPELADLLSGWQVLGAHA